MAPLGPRLGWRVIWVGATLTQPSPASGRGLLGRVVRAPYRCGSGAAGPSGVTRQSLVPPEAGWALLTSEAGGVEDALQDLGEAVVLVRWEGAPGWGVGGVGGLAFRGGGGGFEEGEVGGGAALVGVGAADAVEADVSDDVLEDVLDGAGADVGVEAFGVEAVAEFGVEAGGLGRVGFALDAVFDGAEDAGSGSGVGGFGRVVEGLGEENAEADGAVDAGVGGGDVWAGGERCCGFCGAGVGFGFPVEDADDVGAGFDAIVEEDAVVVGAVLHCGMVGTLTYGGVRGVVGVGEKDGTRRTRRAHGGHGGERGGSLVCGEG